MIPLFSIFSDWGLLILRLVLAAVFLAHGWPKFKNLKVNAQNFEMMGFKPGVFWGTIVAFAEFFGGLALLFGFLAQPAAVFLAIDMLVATFWKIKNGQKFVNGFELDLTLFASNLIIFLFGAGFYALDNFWSFISF